MLVEIVVHEESMNKSGFPKGCRVVIQLDQKPIDDDVILVKEVQRNALYQYRKGYCIPNSTNPIYRKIDVCLIDVIGVVKGGIDGQHDKEALRMAGN